MTASLASHRSPQRPSGGAHGEGGAPAAAVVAAPAAGQAAAAAPQLAALPSPPPAPPLRLVPQPEGLLQIHTAPFRGCFAAVFSQALRSAGLGSRVLVSQFLKGGVDQGPAGSLWLCGRLEWLRPATQQCIEQQCIKAPAAGTDPEVPASGEAPQAVAEVWGYTREQLLAGRLDLLVLDELGLAIDLGYLPADEVTATLEQRPAHMDVILTGPAMPSALMAMADQVTQLRRGF